MLNKIKDTANTTIEKSKEATDASIKYGKKIIRKKANFFESKLLKLKSSKAK